jgi:peptide/nickel transport system substrate-binding protein
LSPLDVKQLQGRLGIALSPSTFGRWYAPQWHVFREPFNNDKLHQAIAHRIDRKRIHDIVMDGKGTISDGPTPPGLWWFDPGIKSYPYDPEQAKRLLNEAGYNNASTSHFPPTDHGHEPGQPARHGAARCDWH